MADLPPEPRLLVVVLNYCTPEMSLRAAEAALADMPKINAELAIVDNASPDGSAATLQQGMQDRGWDADPRVRLILSPVNGGFGAGNNLAIRQGMSDGTAPDLVMLVNSDAFPDRGCIAALIAVMRAHPRAGFAGSQLRGEDGDVHTSAFRFPSVRGEFEAAARVSIVTRLLHRHVVPMQVPVRTTQVDWVAGASVMLRMDMLSQIGLFDETYFLYYEETDLSLRAARAAWQTYFVPESRTMHLGSVSTGIQSTPRKPLYWYDSRRRYFVKNHGHAVHMATLLSHVTGNMLHGLRCLVAMRRPTKPVLHLGDLMRHAMGLNARPAPVVIKSEGVGPENGS